MFFINDNVVTIAPDAGTPRCANAAGGKPLIQAHP
jgi:hypothetical protein